MKYFGCEENCSIYFNDLDLNFLFLVSQFVLCHCVLLCFFFHRGVLQALIKKQFPAPDRKVADLFGIDDFDSGMPGRSSPAPGQRTPKKRKKPGQ